MLTKYRKVVGVYKDIKNDFYSHEVDFRKALGDALRI